MPRPVCVKCSREMVLDRAEVVQFDAISVMGPYEQWQADIAKCPGCGAEVAFRYGGSPSWRHYEKKEKDHARIIIREPGRRLS